MLPLRCHFHYHWCHWLLFVIMPLFWLFDCLRRFVDVATLCWCFHYWWLIDFLPHYVTPFCHYCCRAIIFKDYVKAGEALFIYCWWWVPDAIFAIADVWFSYLLPHFLSRYAHYAASYFTPGYFRAFIDAITMLFAICHYFRYAIMLLAAAISALITPMPMPLRCYAISLRVIDAAICRLSFRRRCAISLPPFWCQLS